MKACDLEYRFPILAVENNCIVSKDADITVAFEVELPELYTVTAAEYEAIHGTWVKAMKVLPNYSVVYKQDWFVKENYRSEGDGTESRKTTGAKETGRKVSCPAAMSVISTNARISDTAASCI